MGQPNSGGTQPLHIESSDEQLTTFLVICRDHTNTAQIRQAELAAHRDHVNSYRYLIVMSGPLLADDDDTRIGQMYVLRASDRTYVESFVMDDPFTRANIFESIDISRLSMRFSGFSRVP